MPRPKRCRTVCKMPKFTKFNELSEEGSVQLTVDEFEVIRLIDYLGYTHDECSKYMNISRTTVTEIYENARYKLSDFLVNGKKLEISGGSYELCSGYNNFCLKSIAKKRKKDLIMRIAVTFDNGLVFGHFGHTKAFKIYDVEDNKIINEEILDTSDSGHCALAKILVENNVDSLICGGLGKGAINALNEANIKIFAGVSGSADEAVRLFLKNELKFTTEANCDHNHDENHSCSDHDHNCSHHLKRN